jgi:hypothetical protein
MYAIYMHQMDGRSKVVFLSCKHDKALFMHPLLCEQCVHDLVHEGGSKATDLIYVVTSKV